jgi:hypothetical protein
VSCPFEEEVLLLRDGDGDTARRLVVEAHLARCTRCARIDEALELVDEHLRRADETPLGLAVHLPPRRRRLPVAIAAAALGLSVWLAWPEARPERTVEVSLPPEPPRLPPPGAAKGPAVAALVAGLDPASGDYAEKVAAAALRVRADGVAGALALAGLLDAEDPRPALAVAAEAPSAALEAPLERLVENRPDLAAPAVRALAAARSVKGLVAALDGPAAAEAREALASIGGREAAAAFERRGDLDALARVDPSRAARACASGGAPGALTLARLVPELRRLLADDRFAAGAARRLGEAGDRASEAELARLAARPTTARGATEALLSLRAFESAFAAARRSRGAATAFDGARDAEAFLLERVDRGLHAERRAALELLARCGGDATVRRLAASGVPRSLMDAAAAALGAIGGEDAIATLDRMAGERALRRDVVRALGATGDPRALPVLRRFTGDEGLADDLCAALGGIRDAEAAEMLADLALRGGASGHAARALIDMPASVVVPVLLGRLEGKGRARELLVRIAGADHGPRPESWREWWDSRP